MLHCLHQVLLYAEDADAVLHIEVARAGAGPINDSAERLDSVNIRTSTEQIRSSRDS